MSAQRAFRPAALDRLESREVPSAIGVQTAHAAALTTAAHKTIHAQVLPHAPLTTGSHPHKTYLSHPNRLSTDPAVLNGQADFVYHGQPMVGNRMSY